MRKLQKNKLIIFILILSIFAVLPFIVGNKTLKLSPSLLAFFPTYSGIIIDVVLYFKAQFFQIVALLLVLFFIGRIIFMDKPEPIPLFKDKRNKKYLITGLIYILFVILSSIFSSNFDTTLSGVPNSWESLFILISYIVIFLLCINYAYEDKLVTLLIKTMPIVFAIFIAFGFVEFFFVSPLTLLAPQGAEFTNFFEQISMAFANPNYAAKFLVLFIPIQFYCINESNGIRRYINMSILFGMYFLLLFTGSTAAIYICLFTTAIIAMIFFKQIIRNIKYIIPVLGIILGISLLITFTTDRDILSTILPNNSTSFKAENPFDLASMEIEDNILKIQGKERSIYISQENNSLIFQDENSNTIDMDKEEKISVSKPSEKGMFTVDLGFQQPIPFVISENNIYALGPNGTLIRNINEQSGFGFENMQSIATSRGYIWRKSLPLVSQTLLLGFGADASTFHIPQNDFTGKLLYHGNTTLILDKPHNMYLQTILNTGLLSLLALLAIFLFYFKSTINLLKKKNNLSILISIGILGYLLCGLFYDSSVTVAPLFWALLGIGVSVNQKSLDTYA